eukprot:Cvel_9921.t1-p1 / transcript=Cvel_9921.t1 / gene=Cvel_9921 / organism=Chromera_velia_CCMP2878 / gene_product=hypothetical protein / transcript_product=hypothetical protein / location=Cvel_scaffold586:24789-26527(+) / protein_length=156 / sequence_SO=supercontig / SO=protein_coding / is_pseudo=false
MDKGHRVSADPNCAVEVTKVSCDSKNKDRRHPDEFLVLPAEFEKGVLGADSNVVVLCGGEEPAAAELHWVLWSLDKLTRTTAGKGLRRRQSAHYAGSRQVRQTLDGHGGHSEKAIKEAARIVAADPTRQIRGDPATMGYRRAAVHSIWPSSRCVCR